MYTGLKYQGKTPSDYQYTLKKLRARRENRSFLRVGTSGRLMGTRKEGMRVDMVDVFCTHIWK
jgi:hypothetical protein